MKKILSLFVLVVLLIVAGMFLKKRIQRTSVSLSQPNKIVVTASFYPLAEFASQVGKELVDVHNLTPAGAEPHDFEPTPQDLVTLQKSTVFVYNGAGLEAWFDKVYPDIKGKMIVVKASDGVSLLQSTEENPDAKVQLPDPHVWMDPNLASLEVSNIANGFMQADATHAQQYKENGKEYQKQLAQLDQEFRIGLAHCQRHEIVTSHDAFEYMARRYGLTVLPISGLSPDDEPSPQKMAEVVQFVRQHNVKYIFFETLVSPKLSETIAKETGAQTIVFNPLEGLTPDEISQGKNYISVQRDNLKNLQIALGCS